MVASIIILVIAGLILGYGLAVATKIFHVAVDERLTKVNEMLPGYNCGACGCPGCSGMAEKLLENTINLKACKPAKEDALLAIQQYLATTPDSDGNVVNVKM